MSQATEYEWKIASTTGNRATRVRAAYYQFDEDGHPFVEFKDASHKVIYSVRIDTIESITRITNLAAGLPETS